MYSSFIMATESRARKLRESLVICTAIGIFFVALTVGMAGILPLYRYLIMEEERNLLLALNAKTVAVEEFLTRTRDVALQISSRTWDKKKFEEYRSGNISRQNLAQFTDKVMLEAINFAPEVWGISRLGVHGEILVQVGVEAPKELLEPSILSSVSTQFLGPAAIGRHPMSLVRIPLTDEHGALAGSDIILFSLVNLQRIIEDYTGLGKTGETVLGLAKMDKIAVIFPFRGNRMIFPENVSLNSQIGVAMSRAAEKQTGILEAKRPLDGKEIIAYGPVRGANWGIALRMSEEELYGPVNNQIFATGSLILVSDCFRNHGHGLVGETFSGENYYSY